ncbi:MAG: cyclopropane fatty acyl phospholipid synthase [Acidimicrobiia bacterium]|nr:cyclopropane fatty acyl phospholipid synthase [Acidimicrobiia bacterium]
MAVTSRASAETFGRELLERAGIEVNGPNRWDLHVHDQRFWDRVIADRELGLGESYQDGWWDTEALDELIERVLSADLQSAIRPSPKLVTLVARSTVANRQTVRRARDNASAHYDTGNDLFEAMLDPLMVYSCAYWRDTDDLAAAQEAKLDLVCRKLELAPGMRLLDIGCGWGGFARFAAERYGCTVMGITPALAQFAVARERCAGLPVEIRALDYRELEGRFDRIVSIGMLEHVGARNYTAFFDRCGELLEPDGMMLHHTIGSNRSKNTTDPWFDKYIFPGGVIPSLGQLARAAERHWAIEDVHNFGPDYDRTLLAWHANIESAWPDLPRYDERFRRTWRYYLLASAGSFRVRNLQLYQVVCRRAGRPSQVYSSPR